MGHRYLLLFTAASISFSFEREKGTIDPLSPLYTPMVLIKDIVITKLLSPFYHFECISGSGDFVYATRPGGGERFQLSSF